MSYLHLDKPALRDLANENPDQPVNVLYLLKFRKAATLGCGVDGLSGQEAFHVYSKKFFELNTRDDVDGEAIWMGTMGKTLIGGEHWDLMVLARYPSRQKFVNLMDSDEYEAISIIRTAGLIDSRVIEAEQVLDPDVLLARGNDSEPLSQIQLEEQA